MSAVVCEGDRCAVSGAVTMRNVTALLDESDKLFSTPHVRIDLSGVTEVDSAAVSLLLEWQRRARRAGRTVEFENIPENVATLAELYGVRELIGTKV